MRRMSFGLIVVLLISMTPTGVRARPQQPPVGVQAPVAVKSILIPSDPNAVAPAPLSEETVVPSLQGRSNASSNLTIIPLFDSSIQNDPNSAAIISTINSVIPIYQSLFTDPITVTIVFAAMPSGLGQSTSWLQYVSYSSFINALRSDSKTTDDATATTKLPSTSTNPVDGTSSIAVKLANLRAVGMSASPGSCFIGSTACDGEIDVNLNLTSPGTTGSSGAYPLLEVLEHEINEVLGLGSSLGSGLSFASTEDLFRYDVNGNRTYSPTDSRMGGVRAYFSIDGTTQLAEFDNQNDGGDYGDWQSNPLRSGVSPKVQDAFATPAASAQPLSVELQALDVIGYDRATGVAAPTITTQPGNQSIAYNSAASLSVSATGSGLSYQWYKGASGVTSSPVGTNSSSYTTPALISNTKYWVQVSNSGGSASSNAAAITVLFTDSTLTAQSTFIKAAHFNELRARIDALRTRNSLLVFSYTHTITATVTTITATDIQEMRTALSQAYVAQTGSSPTFSTTPAVGATVVVADIQDLRNLVTFLENN